MDRQPFNMVTRSALFVLFACMIMRTALIGIASAEPASTPNHVQIPVSFRVVNNEAFPGTCRPDNKIYTVRGKLTLPQSVSDRHILDTVDLYQHALAAGEEYWHIPADDGKVGHVEHMAQRGRASLTIDRLGYGQSDHPYGKNTCLSSDISVNHQIITQLKSGNYTVDSGTAPKFSHVAMIGHSIGGLIAEAEAALYGDVTQIILMNWNGFTFTPQEVRRFPPALLRCASNTISGPNGNDMFEPNADSFLTAATGGNYSQTAISAIRKTQSSTPCGVTTSIPKSIAALAPRLKEITVPVALIAADGDRDLVMTPQQRWLYPHATHHSFWMQPHAGHYGSLAQSSPALFDEIAAQLSQHQN